MAIEWLHQGLNMSTRTGFLIALIVVLSCGGTVSAKKPESPGNSGKAHTENAKPKSQSRSGYFSSERVQIIHSYYQSKKGKGSCPPGLAKKANGCQPPGQAKKWQRGQPLPPNVPYYSLPDALLLELGRSPVGEQIVRVGTDLLVIDLGTRMVLDALEDLGELF